MAKPITTIKKLEISNEEKRKQAITEIEQALTDNKEAVLEGITFLGKLHDSGLLEIANALLSNRHQILENVIKEAGKRPNIDILKNAANLFMLLGTIDIEKLKLMTEKLDAGMAEAAASINEDKTTSIFQLIGALKDPDINRSITMLLQFLKGMGKG